MPSSSVPVSPQDFIRSASHAAHHFGFMPLDKLKTHPSCKDCENKVQHKATAQDKKNDSLSGMLTSGMCTYFDCRLNGIEGPVLFYTIDQVPRSGELAFSLHVMNVRKSIAEALLIQTIRSFLVDVGYKNHIVRINSIGDNDSISRYVRDVTNYLRKRLDEMPPQARELMKEHPISALLYLIEKDHELGKKSPNPTEYLSDSSRKHFREIVEYLDMSGTPFEIDSRLIGHHECYSDALFAFETLTENSEPDERAPFLIRGGRYSNFVSKMTRTKVPAAGAVLVLKDRKAPEHIPAPRVRHNPNIYLIQLGFGPKVKSLLLIDELRRAGIPVHQNIMSDSLSEQLRHAEAKQARYAVILGHKEFMDGTVILRDLNQQNQESIPVGNLTSYLKRVTA